MTINDEAVDESSSSSFSTRALADLAKAGSSLIGEPYMQVRFEVHHVRDQPGYLRELIGVPTTTGVGTSGNGTHPGVPDQLLADVDGQGPDLPDKRTLEMLCSAANGAAVVIGTRAATGGSSGYGVRGAPATGGRKPEDYVFRGVARPNPTFLYENDATFEAIVAVESDAVRPQFRHSVAIRDLIAEISNIAAELDQPLISLQCPAQLPNKRWVDTEMTRREENPTRASSLAVRFSLAVRRPSAGEAGRVTDRLVGYCETHGFGLWVSDTRAGRRSGDWFKVLATDPRRKSDIRENSRGREARVQTVFPITLVGPARVGATQAIVSFLSRYDEIGIISSSMGQFDDLAFIHLQVALHDEARRRLDDPRAEPLRFSSDRVSPMEMLTTVLPRIVGGTDHVLNNPHTKRLAEKAWDYLTLFNGAVPAQYDGTRRYAVWFGWEMDGDAPGLAAPIGALNRAMAEVFDPEKGTANIEYLICRRIRGGRFRGKGKLAVPEDILWEFNNNALDVNATEASRALERRWASILRDEPGSRVRETSVSWRESWLGHWTSLVY